MKTLALLSMLLASVAVQAASPLGVSRLPSCAICKEEPEGSQAAITSKTVGSALHIGVTSFFTCGATLSAPRVVESSSSVTIQVASAAPPPTHEACDVIQQQELSIVGLHSSTKTIYYIQDGTALGHLAMPQQFIQAEPASRVDLTRAPDRQ